MQSMDMQRWRNSITTVKKRFVMSLQETAKQVQGNTPMRIYYIYNYNN